MKKATVISPANIAFVKYWGRRDDKLILPLNSSVSMNLSSCTTTTSCEWGEFEDDTIMVRYQGKERVIMGGTAKEKVLRVVDRVRKTLGLRLRVAIDTSNNFPEGTGIASSASGFSALTKALYVAAGALLSEKELSIETRLSGSGSACRSIPNGFVLWQKGARVDGADSFAHSIAEASHWPALRDLVCVVDTGTKEVSSGEGHTRANNTYMKARLDGIEARVKEVTIAVTNRDLDKLGVVSEMEALSLHTVCMMSEPPIFYLKGATLDLMEEVRVWRRRGVLAYYTMDAGANVHLITEEKYEKDIMRLLQSFSFVKLVISNKPAVGARVV